MDKTFHPKVQAHTQALYPSTHYTCIPNAPLIPTHAYHTDRQRVNLHQPITFTMNFRLHS